MDADDTPGWKGIAEAILEHLRLHPLAADSAEGVARWWLLPPHDHASVEEVERALEALVDQGVLRRLPRAGGSALYALVLPTRQ